MTLSIATLLRGVIHELDARTIPAIGEDYARSTARMAATNLAIAVNWIDDAAEVRVWENATLRSLFAGVAPTIADPALRARLVEAAASVDTCFTLAALDAANDGHRRLLVDLHAAAEQGDDTASHALDDRIWRLIADMETARAPRRELSDPDAAS